MRLKTLESKIRYRIKRSKASVFTLMDFLDLSDRDQIMRSLRELIAQEEMMKIGYGLYAKAKKSPFSGKTVPVTPLTILGKEALNKLGFETFLSEAQKRYNSGLSTQVPTGRTIGVNGRITRKIGYDNVYLTFENATQS